MSYEPPRASKVERSSACKSPSRSTNSSCVPSELTRLNCETCSTRLRGVPGAMAAEGVGRAV
jgi:hypothetical protein